MDWFTPVGFEKYTELKVPAEDESSTVHQKLMKAGWIDALKNSNNVALFDFTRVTAQRFMEYISLQANQKTRKPLSKAGYSSKQSAYFHLV